MGQFIGFVTLGDTLHVGHQTRDASLVPIDADALPAFRVFSPSGQLAAASGQAALLDSAAITGATNANPIVITSASHNLSSGVRVTISGVGGNTNANTSAIVTVLTGNTFSIPVAGNAGYTAGGTWHASGLYDLAIAATPQNGFVAGETYSLHVTWEISGGARSEVYSFGVI
jgi:hypothetical protein